MTDTQPRRMMMGRGKQRGSHPADPHVEDEWCLQMLCETTCRGEYCGHIARKHFPVSGCDSCNCDYWKGEQVATEAEGEMSPYPRCMCPQGYWDERNRIPGQRHQQSCPCWPSLTPIPTPTADAGQASSELDALAEEIEDAVYDCMNHAGSCECGRQAIRSVLERAMAREDA